MSSKISHKEFVEFNRVFSLLLISRVSILDALELIVKQTKNVKFKDIIKKIIRDLKSGLSLSKSFSKYDGIFTDVYIANLRVAEETGMIAEVLNEYTNYQEKFLVLKRKIIQAARYPVFIIVFAIGVMLFMLLFLIPTFEGLFASVKTNIPPLTAFLLGISKFFTENSIIIFLALVLFGFAVNSLLRNKTVKEKFIDRLIIRLPYVSTLFVQNLLARFSLSMAILLKSRVSLLEALKISKQVTTNSLFHEEINKYIKKIIKGESLVANIQNSQFFDVAFTRMLAAGEESAELDKIFYIISDYYNKEFDYRLENINSMVEPILILFVGVIVAVILIAMYLPIFEIVNYMGV